MDKKILQVLQEILGESSSSSQNEWVYFECPFCKAKGKHKQKFHVHSESYAWKCWVCQEKGNNLYSLIRKLGRWQFKDRVQNLLSKGKATTMSLKGTGQKIEKGESISLPSQFLPLSGNNTFLFKKKALNYLEKRGIGLYQINKYNIGVCQTGRYKNRIIIPSYDSDGNLNYFTARSMDHTEKLKYINPKVKRKDIIIFENLINWNFPVILTQGIFDAMTVNFNAIPLMGKIVPDKIVETLLFYDALVIISLDNDAKEEQNKLLNRLKKQGLNQVYFINMKDKDANEMGRFNYWDFLHKNQQKFTLKSSLNMLKEKVLSL